MVRMTEEDLEALRAAAATLEHPSLAARLGNIAGKPIELVGRALPEPASKAVSAATTKALQAALVVALRTMEKEPKAASRLLHKALAAASGAVGGGFGLAALPVELPISTIIMLRSIGDVARSEGRGPRGPGERPCLPACRCSPWGRATARRMRRRAGNSIGCTNCARGTLRRSRRSRALRRGRNAHNIGGCSTLESPSNDSRPQDRWTKARHAEHAFLRVLNRRRAW
jgi:hypothetical protein